MHDEETKMLQGTFIYYVQSSVFFYDAMSGSICVAHVDVSC